MRVPFSIVIATILLSYVCSSPLPQQQLDLDLLQAELDFFGSLSPQQRGLWGKIKDKVTNVAIGAGVNLVAGAVLGKRDVSDEEVDIFFASLTPQQRGLWGKIKDKVTNVAIGTGVNLLAGAVLGKRDVSDEEVDLFFASLTPQQRGLWGKIKDKVTNVAISTAIGAVLG